MIFKYTKYPNAAKEYLRFMMEKEQYEPWQKASIGFVTQPLDLLREQSGLDRGPEEHAVQVLLQEHASERLCRQARDRIGRLHGRFHRGQHDRGSGDRQSVSVAGRDAKRPSGAPSGTTASVTP